MQGRSCLPGPAAPWARQLCWQDRERGSLPTPSCCPHRSPHGPPTSWSRLQGCPITADQTQRRLQTQQSRQVGAIWLQETSGQKNKSRESWEAGRAGRAGRGVAAAARLRASTESPHAGPADGSARDPAWPPPWPRCRPGPAPPGLVKGGGASYTLTAAPHHLPPVWPPVLGDQGTASICLPRCGVPWGLPEWQQDTGSCWGPPEEEEGAPFGICPETPRWRRAA